MKWLKRRTKRKGILSKIIAVLALFMAGRWSKKKLGK